MQRSDSLIGATTTPNVRLWDVLPGSLRFALIVALVTSVTAGIVLYRETGTTTAPEFTRGGPFGGTDQTGNDIGELTIPTPAGRSGVTLRPRSSATITAPESEAEAGDETREAEAIDPALGSYVYSVEGTEEATAFGSRDLPNQMTMTVHEPTPTDSAQRDIADNELIFDLAFSDDHEEREIVSYRRGGISFTFEAWSVTFGITQTSEASYEPAMLQIPGTLKKGEIVEGTSRATNEGGETVRVEDWTVEVEGRETIEVLGRETSTWIVRVDRQTRSGTDEQIRRSRRYWFAPSRAIWVKWEETMRSSRDVGLGTYTYESEYTATLDDIDPL